VADAYVGDISAEDSALIIALRSLFALLIALLFLFLWVRISMLGFGAIAAGRFYFLVRQGVSAEEAMRQCRRIWHPPGTLIDVAVWVVVSGCLCGMSAAYAIGEVVF
jgi:hypothetical protein